MVAAGCGGLHLSAMFRCLLYDSRHHCGGSARSSNSSSTLQTQLTQKANSLALTELGEWVEEELSEEAKKERETASQASLLINNDDEFLGCSKIDDSAAQSTSRWRKGGRDPQKLDNGTTYLDSLPPDFFFPTWIVLSMSRCPSHEPQRWSRWKAGTLAQHADRVGNARVCTFGKSK